MAVLWLRDETKPDERRTCLLPEHANALIKSGHQVVVERSKLRIIPNVEYEQAGCTLVLSNSWIKADKSSYILGIKALPHDTFPLIHQHIYFAHCYKTGGQDQTTLNRFKNGGGTLLDAEYLTGEQGQSFAARHGRLKAEACSPR